MYTSVRYNTILFYMTLYYTKLRENIKYLIEFHNPSKYYAILRFVVLHERIYCFST